MRLFNLLAAVLVFGLAASTARSQSAVSSGILSGQVDDTSGAAAPNVRVSAVNVATEVKYSATTNAEGLYRFPPLPVGMYKVTFSHDGFATAEVPDVQLSVGGTTTVSPSLQVGAVNQQVTVAATAAMLHPTDSSLSTVVEQHLISDLPLNGRRYTDFVLLTPNVTADGDFGLVSMAGQQGGADSGYANGNGSNSFTVDGANATSSYFGEARGRTRVPYVFGEQSIQEFQVTDNPYSAAYGGGGSGFVNTITKSGTNDSHGDAFYYNRNSGTGANRSLHPRVRVLRCADATPPYTKRADLSVWTAVPLRPRQSVRCLPQRQDLGQARLLETECRRSRNEKVPRSVEYYVYG